MRNATFRQLRVFSEVARHLSFARAAEALHLTPPAVTMQVKELEAHVGLPLFDRSGRQVALTTAGEYMLVYARRMLATLKDAEDAAARLKGVELGQLVIGMVSTAKYFLPKLLARFREEPPGWKSAWPWATASSWWRCCTPARWTSPSWAARPRSWPRAPSPSPRTRTCSWRRRGMRWCTQARCCRGSWASSPF